MKKITFVVASVAMMLFASCQKSIIQKEVGEGFLSFGGFSLEVDETVETKAEAASDNYSIKIYDADENLVKSVIYADVKENDDKLSLPAGNYTLVASSVAGNVPVASWENPIYGVTKAFTIQAGEETEIGELVCTLVQCKVTVAYNDEFLASVTGEGTASVEVTANHPLEYQLNANGTYNQDAGYFSVGPGSTMTVVFTGSFEGKTAKMTKTFKDVKAKQWRQIRFIKKVDEQGQATFDIVINDLISDATLNSTQDAKEDVIGTDPDAPKGDGGITLDFDYEAGCDTQLTDFNNMLIVPEADRDMNIMLKAVVPGKVYMFTVDITSDNANFLEAVDLAEARHIDLINPTAANNTIFEVVPFPHGQDLVGQTEILFDLSNAQGAILIFPGRHTFTMTIVDETFCKKEIPVTMIVE